MQLNSGSTVQVAEQPSCALVLPSSHCSAPVTRPSPQTGAHIDGEPLHAQPVSTVHPLEQPSPFVRLPSSQPSTTAVPEGSHDVSLEMPLPHFSGVSDPPGLRPQPERSWPFWFQCGFLPSGYAPAVVKSTVTLPPGVVRPRFVDA